MPHGSIARLLSLSLFFSATPPSPCLCVGLKVDNTQEVRCLLGSLIATLQISHLSGCCPLGCVESRGVLQAPPPVLQTSLTPGTAARLWRLSSSAAIYCNISAPLTGSQRTTFGGEDVPITTGSFFYSAVSGSWRGGLHHHLAAVGLSCDLNTSHIIIDD